MGKAQVVVDFWGFGSESGGSTVYQCADFEAAQAKCAELGTEWAADGWKNRGGVWAKGIDWRQKVVVYAGVEYAEEEAVDG